MVQSTGGTSHTTVVPDIQLHRRLGLVPHRALGWLACCEGEKKRSEQAMAGKLATRLASKRETLAPIRRRRARPASPTVLPPLLLLSPRFYLY